MAGTGRLPYLMEGESARGRRRAAEPNGGTAESTVASGRDGVASSHLSSAAADSLERQPQERLEARLRSAVSSMS